MVGVRLGVDVLVAVPVGAGGVEVFVGDGGGSVDGRQAVRMIDKMMITKVSCRIYKPLNYS